MIPCLLAFFTTAVVAAAQTSGVHFEVASVKPSRPDASVKDMRLSFENDRFEAINITLKEMISAMSGFSMSRKVEGGPRWAETDRYDVVAKAERIVPVNDRNAAVMSFLEDRFQLVTHREKKETQGLALTVGKAEPAIRRSESGSSGQVKGDRHHLVFQEITLFGVANYLSQIWRTTVEDQTNLRGAFDFSLDLDRFATTPSDQFGDLLRSAISDLGFVLQARKVMIETTVIDHAERPIGN